MSQSSDTGRNRTGIATSPNLAQEMLEGVRTESPHSEHGGASLSEIRGEIARDAGPIGTVPPPVSMKGLFTTAKEILKGNKPTVFIDKLGERLAFERSGVRLYQGALDKFDAHGGWDGGPSRAELKEICDEEQLHLELLQESITRLGADPTAMTPSANLVGVMGAGLVKVITDPRTTLPEALQALLVAERADVDGWTMLTKLADETGQSELVEEFRQAHRREQEHAERVVKWVENATEGDLNRQLAATV